MRYLRRNGLLLPVRPLLGPFPHEVVWRDADSVRICNILQNPAYAGAYVYGRRQKDPSRCRPGSLTGTVKVAIADWAVCLHAAHPGYIGWEEFMANQRRWQATSTGARPGTPACRARARLCCRVSRSAAGADVA
ncbi:recombinase family protein [Bradyrhizobium sp. S3.12.5]|uniref:recombinase family protein n=1 Tax=Bradyrhizobium sp. S3.12.5 TaxID=3156386 RepID=UPI0033918FA0